MTILTLTTDFGVADGYVGVMKGVILSIAPQARLVDLSHHIPPQDVRRAALLLYTAAPFFPADTVHLAVIDPGVGSARRPLALRTPAGTFVGPDNGLFSYLSAAVEWTAVELRDPAYRLPHPGDTFHGRDIFAPVAAHLAAGVPLEALGPPLRDPVALPLPALTVAPGLVTGEVLYSDHFGNLVTSIGLLRWGQDGLMLRPAFRSARQPLSIPPTALVEVDGRTLTPIRHTYSDVAVGEPLALVGSSGFLEIAVRQGDARQTLGVRPGATVLVRF